MFSLSGDHAGMTILIAWLASAAGPDAALVARADELNQRYVECLFAVSREAQAQGVAEGRFSTLLASSCGTERARMHRVLVKVLVQRGSTQEQAEAQWSRLEEQGRASVERAYRLGRSLSQ